MCGGEPSRTTASRQGEGQGQRGVGGGCGNPAFLMRILPLLLALTAADTASASLAKVASRRAILGSTLAAAIPARVWVMGAGDTCADLAEGNELILQLQVKSRANREKNEQALIDKTVANMGYDDFFTVSQQAVSWALALSLAQFLHATRFLPAPAPTSPAQTVNKVMVKNEDGSYSALDNDEYARLRMEGKIVVGGAPGVDVLKQK
jgi:hypothetical protein